MCVYIKKANITLRTLASLTFLIVGIFSKTQAQSLQRQGIGSAGSYVYAEGTLIQQTVGQPYSTNTRYDDNLTYRPGFQQPIFKVNLIRTTINLDVFPNPATNWVTLKSTKTLSDVKIQVVDIAGKLIVNQQVDEFNSYTINCEEWPNGIYVISVADNGNNSYSSKLIILK